MAALPAPRAPLRAQVRSITRQVLTALDYLHSIGLIHCDLKPENILIRSLSKCVVKLIDFGSSSFVHDPHSSYVQSRSYRAPEVVVGMPYGQKIDLWSLGCILVEIYTGRTLFCNRCAWCLFGYLFERERDIPVSGACAYA